MPRPKILRNVSGYPFVSAFGPKSEPSQDARLLSIEEMEAIRLSDFEGMDQQTAAELMGVSRQTYGRILGRAHYLIAEALVTGKDLVVQGGDYVLQGRIGRQRRHRGHHRKW
jgi:uncharacterized protein